eukprot:772193-Pelagomonas_calceolata.AAC.2
MYARLSLQQGGLQIPTNVIFHFCLHAGALQRAAGQAERLAHFLPFSFPFPLLSARRCSSACCRPSRAACTRSALIFPIPTSVCTLAHLSELQATAERLARGHGLRLLGSMGSEELRLRHPDFEFFHSRS